MLRVQTYKSCLCHCKKNGSLEPLLKYLEGFFDCVGSPLYGKNVPLEDIYGVLLTSLYQLDDDGNKVIVDLSKEDTEFVIDVNRPVYVGSLRDNSDSNFIHKNNVPSNLCNDIVNLGFKPYSDEYAGHLDEELRSFVIDADEDSVLPISYDKDLAFCSFSNNIRALLLPKINFYIYEKLDRDGNLLPQFDGGFGIKRGGYEMTGRCTIKQDHEYTGAIDQYGNNIQRIRVSVLMLPVHNEYSSKFELFGHSNGLPGSDYDVKIEEYSFDSSVNYGEEVDANGVHGLVNVNFVNADSNHADLVPTYSCQFIGTIDS